VTGWRSASALCLAVLLLAAPASAGEARISGSRLFTFADDDIFESSGLVDRGAVVFTVNDSGDDAVVYGVDPSSGRTVSHTTFAHSVEDVEAVAPGARGTLWVGDTGDNRHSRDGISVFHVRPGEHDRAADRFDLAYPDGPHDAETLLVQPRTQQVFVVSKSVFGGTVYAAPRTLSAGRPNQLRAYAQVRGLVTDGTFFPDGRHVLLRTYGEAMVYTFPAFALVGTVRLPSQPQGEGISVGPGGRVLLSTEGVHADVLQVKLPAALTAARPGSPTARPSPPPLSERADPQEAPRRTRDWTAIAVAAAAVVGLGFLALRASRLHGPR
jgi:hypothetical protein